MRYAFFVIVFLINSLWAQKSTPTNLDNSSYFIENKGQFTSEDSSFSSTNIDFILTSGSKNVFISRYGIFYQKHFVAKLPIEVDSLQKKCLFPKPGKVQVFMSRIDMKLLGSNSKAAYLTKGKSRDFSYFYNRGINKKVYGYTEIRYVNIYPQIDWVLKIVNGLIKHEFVIHPGANYQQINWCYSGSLTNYIADDGKIIIASENDTIVENAPIAFQENSQEKIQSKFKKVGNNYCFELGQFDANRTLIIDPLLHWATYYCSESSLAIGDIESDKQGNVYCTGSATKIFKLANKFSSNYYLDTAYVDGFIVKFDKHGNKIWTCFYGGESTDVLTSISVNSSLKLFAITGYTLSKNGISTFGGPIDSFRVKSKGNCFVGFIGAFDLDANLKWSRYWGASNDTIENFTTNSGTFGTDIKLDNSGKIVVVGGTLGKRLGITGTLKNLNTDKVLDGFVLKLNTNGVLVWATFYGGSDFDWLTGVDIDVNNNIYVVGVTYSKNSANCIATDSSYKTNNNNLNTDLYFGKFTSSGKRVWGSFFGGWANETQVGYSLLKVKNDRIYFGGQTKSEDSIASNNAYIKYFKSASNSKTQHSNSIVVNVLNGGENSQSFIANFNLNGKFQWATYLANSSLENWIYDIATNDKGDVFACGSISSSNDVCSSLKTHQTSVSGREDAFITQFDKDGKHKDGTFFGGESNIENGTSLCQYNGSVIYLWGSTFSKSKIATTGTFQESYNSPNINGFLAKFCYPNDTTLHQRAIKQFTWDLNNVTYYKSGLYKDTLSNINGCDSIVYLDLTIDTFIKIIKTVKICDSYFWFRNHKSYFQSGVFYDTVKLNSNKILDTLFGLNLVILQKSKSTTAIQACDSFFWNQTSKWYSRTDIIFDTLKIKNQFGCDSILEMILTIYKSHYDTIKINSCDSFYWPQKLKCFYNSGIYIDTLPTKTSFGCPQYKVLILKINKATYDTTIVESCKSYYWKVANQTYYKSGIYTRWALSKNRLGCDSFNVLKLTINYPKYVQFYDTVNDYYLIASKQIKITKSGQYFDTTKSFNSSCDSITELNLIIKKTGSLIDTVFACSSYFWSANNMWYYSSGTYQFKLITKNYLGNDSFHKLVVILQNPQNLPLSEAEFSKIRDTVACGENGFKYQLNVPKDIHFIWLDRGDSINPRPITRSGKIILQLKKGCFQRIDTFSVNIVPKPSLINFADTLVCTLPVKVKLTATNASWTLWNDGDTSRNKEFTQLGNYNCQLGNVCGVWSLPFQIKMGEELKKVLPDSISFCEGKELILSGLQLVNEPVVYQWNTGQKNANLNLNQGGQFELITQTKCYNRTDKVFVDMQFCGCKLCIPNAVTPLNEDGLNDGWKPDWSCSEHECQIESGTYQIYNRWGEKLADLSIFESWNGQFMGKPVPEGVYLYKVQAMWDKSYPRSRHVIFSGHIMVLSGLK